jgi:hypothetical protein
MPKIPTFLNFECLYPTLPPLYAAQGPWKFKFLHWNHSSTAPDGLPTIPKIIETRRRKKIVQGTKFGGTIHRKVEAAQRRQFFSLSRMGSGSSDHSPRRNGTKSRSMSFATGMQISFGKLFFSEISATLPTT